MTADLHRQASAIFDQACHLALADRSSYLDSACGSDAALRSHVEQLLAADLAAADTFLMEPAVFATAPFFESGGRQPAPTLVGRRLGNYDVGQQIGAGGMGTVFEARDRRLNRQVALKVLAVARHNDDDFVARFRREAHLASLLNHPNILSIYEADEDGGICFMATEFVAGKTLRELARQGPLPVKQLLDIASQAAFALAAAHEAGIVHRDIKPDNIMVRHDGLVKVLDFGLAKLGLTITSLASAPSVKTKPGFIAGTAHYLSPEQALGKPASPGSDLFSLGVVLYELATGVRPFTGASELAVFNAILRDSPRPPSDLRPDLGPELDELIRRLLEKDPQFRFQTAADLHSSIRRLARNTESGLASLPSRDSPVRRRWKRAHVSVPIATLALALLVSVWWWMRTTRLPAASDSLPGGFERLTSAPGEETFPNLSPDGAQSVYAGANQDIYLQRTKGSTVVSLTNSLTGGGTQPALARDGTKIAFHSERNGGGLFVMEVTGENVTRVSSGGYLPAWAPDGKLLVYSDGTFTDPSARGEPISRLHILNPSTGEDRALKTADAIQPDWSPHGHRIAFWGLSAGGRRSIFTVPSAGGESVIVTGDTGLNWHPVWAPDGKSLYFLSDRGGVMNLWRVPINEKSGKTQGTPAAVTLPTTQVGSFRFSADGRAIVFSNIERAFNLFSVPYDAAKVQVQSAPEPVLSGTHHIVNISFSPDGSQMAYDTVGAPEENLWVINRDGSGRHRLNTNPSKDRAPSWSPVSDEIAFFSDRSGRYEIWVIRADGSGLRQVTETVGPGMQAPNWSRDGTFIYASRESGTAYAIPAHRGLIRNPALLEPALSAAQSIFNRESPNGAFLVLSGFDAGSAMTVYSRARKTAEKIDVSANRAIWLPDSSGFLYARGGKCQYYDLKTRTARTLFDVTPARLKDIDIAAGRVYFTRVVRDGDLWIGSMGTH